jgi:hypothetical protein
LGARVLAAACPKPPKPKTPNPKAIAGYLFIHTCFDSYRQNSMILGGRGSPLHLLYFQFIASGRLFCVVLLNYAY